MHDCAFVSANISTASAILLSAQAPTCSKAARVRYDHVDHNEVFDSIFCYVIHLAAGTQSSVCLC